MSERDWLLVDGALVGHTTVADELRAAPDALALYQDLGREAAAVGPWLIPSTAEVEAILDRCRSERESASFGIARLRTTAHSTALIDHLQALRYVCSARKPDKRYFFRYADHRGLAALWPALRAAQQCALLGPIMRWSWRTLRGSNMELVASSIPTNDCAATLPLHLQAGQFQSLMEESRIGDLVTATSAAFPEFTGDFDLARRYDAVRLAMTWSTTHDVGDACVQMAVVLVAAKSAGQALEDAAFLAAVRRAQSTSDLSPVLSWQPVRHPPSVSENSA